MVANSRLRTAVWALRRILEPEDKTPGSVLTTDRTGICLVAQAFTTDVADFEQALRAARQATGETERALSLVRAVELYSGDLLPGCYEEWIAPERDRLADAYRQTLSQAASAVATAGDLPRAIEYARRAVTADPLQEEVHAALIALYLRSGRAVDAKRQYQELERVLYAEMGLKPSASALKMLEPLLSSQTAIPSVPMTPSAVKANEPVSALTISSDSPVVAIHQAVPCLKLEPEGGPVPLNSPFYIDRKIDTLFAEAVARQDSIVLVKGARQMGKPRFSPGACRRRARQAKESF